MDKLGKNGMHADYNGPRPYDFFERKSRDPIFYAGHVLISLSGGRIDNIQLHAYINKRCPVNGPG